MKEGNRSANEILSGLKARKVVSRKRVNSRRKIRNKLLTHMIVFGILYLLNMNQPNALFYRPGKTAKEIKLNRLHKCQVLMLPVTRSSYRFRELATCNNSNRQSVFLRPCFFYCNLISGKDLKNWTSGYLSRSTPIPPILFLMH